MSKIINTRIYVRMSTKRIGLRVRLATYKNPLLIENFSRKKNFNKIASNQFSFSCFSHASKHNFIFSVEKVDVFKDMKWCQSLVFMSNETKGMPKEKDNRLVLFTIRKDVHFVGKEFYFILFSTSN